MQRTDRYNYVVRPTEQIRIEVVAIGVGHQVKADLDGKTLPLHPGSPAHFKFEVTQPSGGLHIVNMDFDFSGELPVGAKYEVRTQGSRGGNKWLVATITPDMPDRKRSLNYKVD